MRKTLWSIFLLLILVFSACKTAPPIGPEVAKPVKVAFFKGPIITGAGKLYFLEEKAVYQPSRWFYNFQKVPDLPYAEIKSAKKSKILGILPLAVDLEMIDGKHYRFRVNSRKLLVERFNSLKLK